MSAELKPKKMKGRITVLKVLPYKESMIYVRMVDNDIFMYDLIFKNQLYSAYLIMTPKNGFSKLSKDEINQSAALIFAGAVTTIDTLSGEGLDKRAKEVVATFEGARPEFERKKLN